jgi:hypothetical protein
VIGIATSSTKTACPLFQLRKQLDNSTNYRNSSSMVPVSGTALQLNELVKTADQVYRLRKLRNHFLPPARCFIPSVLFMSFHVSTTRKRIQWYPSRKSYFSTFSQDFYITFLFKKLNKHLLHILPLIILNFFFFNLFAIKNVYVNNTSNK